MLTLTLVPLALLFVYFALVRPFQYWRREGVQSYRFWEVWIQWAQALLQYRSLGDGVLKLYNDFPGVRFFGGYNFHTPVLIVKDPELIKLITVKDFNYFTDHTQFVPDDVDPFGSKNLVALRGSKWRNMRAVLSPSFTGSKMKIMFGLIADCAQQLVQYFEDKEQGVVVAEMKDIFTRYTNDVIASTAFGVTCNSLKDRENTFYLMGKKATSISFNFKLIFTFLAFMACPRLMKFLGIKLPNDDVATFFKNTIKDNIEVRERDGIVRPDMIYLMMEAQKERSKTETDSDKNKTDLMTSDDIAAQAMIFFFAGFESVATLMCFMAYELALNPNVQQTLHAEITEALQRSDGNLTFEVLSKMKYMNMVISETLRKWPVAVLIDRVCVKPYTIEPIRGEGSPIQIRTGMSVNIPVFGFHRDPQYYPNPDLFDPERFSDDNKANINPYAYIPFGSGPRNCIGSRFAIMETKLVFFYMLLNFEIVVVEKTPIPLKLSSKHFQMYPEGGFWLGLKKRTESTVQKQYKNVKYIDKY